MNSVKSSDFMSPRGALAMLCHAPRARILCKKYHAGDMRARRRERMPKSFPGASWGFVGLLGLPGGAPGASWAFLGRGSLGPSGDSWGLLGLPGVS